MKVTRLDFDAYNELNWARYAIALTENFTEEHARSEYYESLDELMEALKRFGSHNAFGKRDFATGGDWYGPHRSLSFEITSDRLLTPLIFPAVQFVIRSFRHPYVVAVGYDPFLNGSRHGLCPGDFYASVETNSVTITTENELVLSLLGVREQDGPDNPRVAANRS